MREGNCEMIVVETDGEPVEERLIKEDTVAVAVPGAMFRVKLHVFPPTTESSLPCVFVHACSSTVLSPRITALSYPATQESNALSRGSGRI
jgi:hypothetical protein